MSKDSASSDGSVWVPDRRALPRTFRVPRGLTLKDCAEAAALISAWADEPARDTYGMAVVAKAYRLLRAADKSPRGDSRKT